MRLPSVEVGTSTVLTPHHLKPIHIHTLTQGCLKLVEIEE